MLSMLEVASNLAFSVMKIAFYYVEFGNACRHGEYRQAEEKLGQAVVELRSTVSKGVSLLGDFRVYIQNDRQIQS